MTIIRVENLSKKYVLRHQQRESYSALRDVISEKIQAFGNTLIHPFAGHHAASTDSTQEEFWALRDVSFDIYQGDRIGIIGRNGAGKSTLLKILSRITEPTAGKATIKGRVASLLEVGTGFHPELTGRENIFLNGAILGMSRFEIKHKFDEIVAFAETERFLDTPVKHYSSGMYVRLAFAVAAHLEPEVLIVDEVLAVGDAQFQKKCLWKMEKVGNEGRTVIFVSHNMQAIRQMCDRVILLRSGKIIADAEATEAIGQYLQEGTLLNSGKALKEIVSELPPDPVFRLVDLKLTQNSQEMDQFVENGKPLKIEIRYDVLQVTTGLRVYFDLCDDQDTLIFRSFHDEDNDGIPTIQPGSYSSIAVIPANFLGPVRYELRIRSGIFNVRSCLPDSGVCIPIKVEMTGRYNRGYLGDTFRGKLGVALEWVTERLV